MIKNKKRRQWVTCAMIIIESVSVVYKFKTKSNDLSSIHKRYNCSLDVKRPQTVVSSTAILWIFLRVNNNARHYKCKTSS